MAEKNDKGIGPLQFDLLACADKFGMDVRIHHTQGDGHAVAHTVVMKKHKEGTLIPSAMHLEPEELQSLANALGRVGIYPRNIDRHVKDLELRVKSLEGDMEDIKPRLT